MTFSETVDVTGTPRLPLDIGGTTRYATAAPVEGATVVDFTYTVDAADYDADGFEISENTLELDGGTIRRAGADVDADLDHPGVGASSDYTVNGVVIDEVRMVSEAPHGRFYTLDDDIEIGVTFNRSVKVTGTPQLAFCLNRSGQSCKEKKADYDRGSDSETVVFRYTVQAGDEDNNGIWIGADAVSLNGGAITQEDDSSRAANLGHGVQGTQADHRVNALGEIIGDGVTVTSSPRAATATYGAGERIEITVTFGAPVIATNNTDFVLSVVGAKRAPLLRGSGTDQLVFGYTVEPGDEDNNGIWIGDQSRTLVGIREGDPQNGAITRVATGLAAGLTHGGLGTQSGHKVDGSLTPPNSAPVITTTSPVETPENGTAVATLAATDFESDPITWSTTGGADADRFALTTAGALTFVAAPDYESPADVASGDPANAAADNEYVVFVTASDGTDGTELELVVRVTNVDEGQSGTVSIDDTAPVVGDELTASTTNVVDPDGLPDPFEPTWQWYYSVSNFGEFVIPGATSATFTVGEFDIGLAYIAKASWTDAGGFANTLASAPTAESAFCTVNPGDLWCAGMTVEQFPLPGGGIGKGVWVGQAGELTNDTFPYGGELYRVQAVYYVSAASSASLPAGALALTIEPVVPDGLTLLFGGEEFSESNAMRRRGEIFWERSGVNWSLGDEVTLRLRPEAPPTVTVAAATGGETVTEGRDAAFTLSRTEATTVALTVTVKVSETGAVLKDASVSPSSVTFDVGAATATPALATDDDDTDNDDGTVTVTLGAGLGYTMGDQATATVAVSDNDVPVDFELSVPATVAEDAGTVTVTVTVTVTATTAENALPATGMVVQLARVAGTATGGSDYAAVSETATFQVSDFAAVTVDGQSRYQAEWTHDVVIHDDEVVEGDETLVLEMSPTSAFLLIHTLHGAQHAVQATLTIVDNDVANAAPTAADQTVTTDEDTAYAFDASDFGFVDTDTDDELASVRMVTLPGSGTLAVSGSAVSADQEVAASDLGGNLTFTPAADGYGSGYASFTFRVSDGTAESASTYTMTIDVTPVNDAPAAADQTVTTDEDTAYAFDASDFGFVDADTGDGLASVRVVTLPGSGTLAVSGAAVSADQEVAVSDLGGNLTFTPAADGHGIGYASFTFRVSDGTAESASDYTMTIDVTPVNDAPSAGTVTIDDTAPVVGDELTATAAGIADPDGLPAPLTLSWQWYRTPAGGSETEIAGAMAATYTVGEDDAGAALTAKATYQDSGGFANTLESAPTGAVGRVPVLSVGNASATEGNAVSFQVALTAASTQAVTVDWASSAESGDTAGSGDFTAANGALTFAAGQTEKTVTVSTTEDTTDEDDETFTLRLSNATNATLATDPTATGTIRDDDEANAPPPPVAPEGEATAGSYTSLDVRWAAPTGGPAVTGYELRYREHLLPVRAHRAAAHRQGGAWTEWPHRGTGTEATITGLKVNTAYEVDVRAVYGEVRSAWVRVPGTVRTGAPEGARIRSVTVVSGPGSDGVWGAGERVELEVRYNLRVAVEQPEFIRTRVFQVNVRAPAGGDGAWTAGDPVRVDVRFTGPASAATTRPPNWEEVVVDETGGTPSIGVRLGDGQSRPLARTATYETGSRTNTLTFEYAVTAGDGRVSAVEVVADSLARNGATMRNERGYDAELDHLGRLRYASLATVLVRGAAAVREGGTLKFPMELARASEGPVTVDYATADGKATAGKATAGKATAGKDYTAKRGTVTFAPGRTRETVEVRVLRDEEAEDAETVVLRLSNAHSAGSEAPVEVTVPEAKGMIEDGAPEAPTGVLTARFARAPAEHDGKTAFKLLVAFSEGIKIGFRTFRDQSLSVSGGSVKSAKRVEGRRDLWEVKVKPGSLGDVTVTLEGGRACGTAGAVCTGDGRALSATISTTVLGPVALSVADARVREAEDALLVFEVTLDRACHAAVTVDYVTSDVTARAGEDYTSASGTLTFATGERSKTVEVTVLDDAHDEGEETLTLTLSNASGARIEDATATGTIENTDPMPKAWMVRFGRTVGSQVVDALNARLDGAGGSHVTVAGINLIGAPGLEPQAEDDDPFGLPEWAKNAEREADARTITAEDIRLRSAFHLSSGGDGTHGGGPAFTAWGQVATGGFEAEEDDVAMDGDVTTGLVGFDAEWERALAGVMLSQSSGDGSYRLDPELGDDAGTVESSLTGVYPYANLDLNARVSAWALAGVGSGELTLKRDGHREMPTDISMRMGAVGVKGKVLDGTGASGVSLDVKTDAMWVGTKSERTNDMVATEGDVMRLRLILQGERRFEGGNGATFTPSAEVGLRHDGGDAETGTGVEVGAGLRYTAGAVTVEAQARTLLVHEASGYEEWGASGAIRVTPDASGRGFTLSIAPVWGRTGSAAERLWSAHDARALGEDSGFEAGSRLALDAGYGFGLAHRRSVLTPYAGLTLGDAGNRTVRTGTRWQLGPDAVVALEGFRQASDAGEADNRLMLRVALRF